MLSMAVAEAEAKMEVVEGKRPLDTSPHISRRACWPRPFGERQDSAVVRQTRVISSFFSFFVSTISAGTVDC